MPLIFQLLNSSRTWCTCRPQTEKHESKGDVVPELN
jgi:hypothetical protein